MNNNSLGITLTGGIVALCLALILRKKFPTSHGVHTWVMILAGTGLAFVLASIMQILIGLLATGLHRLGGISLLSSWKYTGTVIDGLIAAMPYLLGIGMLTWVVIDLMPKKGPRPSRHTTWVGFLVPAALAIMPPVSRMIGLGG